jgi:hypothetical protein
MASDSRDWSVPPPVRALLWWPAAAFVIAMVAPDTAGWSIAAAGLALALLGALRAAAARLVTRSGAPAVTAVAHELPTSVEQRVA